MGGGGVGRRWESRVDAPLHRFLKGHFGSEEVGGPLCEDAEVVLAYDLWYWRWGVSSWRVWGKGGERGRGEGGGRDCVRIWPLLGRRRRMVVGGLVVDGVQDSLLTQKGNCDAITSHHE